MRLPSTSRCGSRTPACPPRSCSPSRKVISSPWITRGTCRSRSRWTACPSSGPRSGGTVTASRASSSMHEEPIVTFPSALSDVGTSGADDRAVETACANALVADLPGTALMAQRHGGAPVPPAELAAGVSATYVGAHSADFALILLDRDELTAAAGGDASRVRLGDVLRPALEH